MKARSDGEWSSKGARGRLKSHACRLSYWHVPDSEPVTMEPGDTHTPVGIRLHHSYSNPRAGFLIARLVRVGANNLTAFW